MAVQMRIDFYVRISDFRHPELFNWLREACQSTGMTPQEVAIYGLSELMRRTNASGGFNPMSRMTEGSAQAAATPDSPAANQAAPVAQPPSPAASNPPTGQGVPIAPFGPSDVGVSQPSGLLGGLMDRGN
jgi:hypothetical protein